MIRKAYVVRERIPPALAVERLSPRQLQVLRLSYEHRSTKEIATTIGLSEGTIDNYLSSATKVLGARNRREACRLLRAFDESQTPQMKSHMRFQRLASSAFDAALPGWRKALDYLRSVLPLRPEGALGNDHNLFYRVGWIVKLAVAAAIGFGMLAVGFEVVSRLFVDRR